MDEAGFLLLPHSQFRITLVECERKKKRDRQFMNVAPPELPGGGVCLQSICMQEFPGLRQDSI